MRDQQVPTAVDAVVAGGGHAGIEAAWALARLGHSVALITFDRGALARMSCNPSIGGLAKGQLVREIDACGGLMGRLIDRTGIHFRMLNARKGAAVRAPRAQADKRDYARAAALALAGLSNVFLIEGELREIVVARGPRGERRVVGVRLAPVAWSRVTPGGAHSDGARRPHGAETCAARRPAPGELACRTLVLAVGTFLGARVFTGMEARPGGRRGEPPADPLSDALRGLGLRMSRLKTGTPPRLHRRSIDFTALEVQPGDEPPPRFSFFEDTPVRNRVVCHLTRTTERTHAVIRAALDRSPLFGGLIQGRGPRYCPSIEDKVVRFPERVTHQIFLEPEGVEAAEIYPNGISTSLPEDVQQAYVRTIPGLEAAEIVHPGYAVEYDFLPTSQIDTALRVRGITGLFAAGQINGTSGYEEAAAQGMIAGINAHAFLTARDAFVLRRDEGYIGVLIDDLTTKTPSEPYRMFTSQSEYRLLLRQDNADVRLSARAREIGLLAEADWRRVSARGARLARGRGWLHRRKLERDEARRVNAAAQGEAGEVAQGGEDAGRTAEAMLRRPAVDLAAILCVLADGQELGLQREDVVTLEADVKYHGYLERSRMEIARARRMEAAEIPAWLLADLPTSLSLEAREKIRERRPRTLGQAARIPGVSPCDVSIMAILIHARSGGAPAAVSNAEGLPQ